jgi:hypothetical protein
MFASPPQKVLYCYSMFQPLFEQTERELPFIKFHQGLPLEEELTQLAI